MTDLRNLCPLMEEAWEMAPLLELIRKHCTEGEEDPEQEVVWRVAERKGCGGLETVSG